MILPKFNKTTVIRKPQRPVNLDRLNEVKSLLRRRYKQSEIAEMTGMSNSVLSDFMAYHGLRKPE